MNKVTYKNWQFFCDEENVVWLTLDKQGAAVNTMSSDVMLELNNILDDIGNQDYQGVIIQSGKSSGFIAGADIKEMLTYKDVNEAYEAIRYGQKVFDKLEKLHCPSVALINGYCIGGGMELALACDYRIANENEKTKLGLPEVKLGIHPGWGGTVRLPRIIGGLKAMELILSGRVIHAKQAAKIHMIDACVPERQLVRAAQYFIKNRPKKQKQTWWQRILTVPPFHFLAAGVMRNRLNKKVKAEHYPAPFRVLKNWIKKNENDDKAYINEARSVAKLFDEESTKNLVRVFFLQDKLKSLAKNSNVRLKSVHVVGAGTMGGDIAAWCALQGFQVTLQDREPAFIAPAMKRAYLLFKKKLHKPVAIQQVMDRLMPDVQGLGVKTADIIIEAVFENLKVKQTIFKELEQKAKVNAILATNTSSIPLDKINCVMKNPKRLIGIHFFNPVAYMPLIEIVSSESTDSTVEEKANTFVRAIDRLPLPVKSTPGFLVNRILMQYLLEAMTLYDEGIPAVAIDSAAEDFGMSMGPIELSDTIGLDVCLNVANNLAEHFSISVPDTLKEMVKAGNFGKKTAKGFYSYKNNKIKKPRLSKDDMLSKDLAERLIVKMIKEAKDCLQEGVVASEDLLDAGMVFGSGFAPFRGGLMQYAHWLEKNNLKISENQAEGYKANVIEDGSI